MTKSNRPNLGRARWDLTNLYLTAGVLTLVILVQVTLLARLRLGGAAPNLLLAVVVCWSLIRGFGDGILWGFVGGLGIDIVSGLPLGSSALALMLICPLASLGKNSVFPGSLTLPALLIILATPVHGWILLFIRQTLGVSVAWLASTTGIIGPEIVLNVLLVPVVYPALRWLASPIRPVQMEW
jgi:rod shape-determining protein MreD